MAIRAIDVCRNYFEQFLLFACGLRDAA